MVFFCIPCNCHHRNVIDGCPGTNISRITVGIEVFLGGIRIKRLMGGIRIIRLMGGIRIVGFGARIVGFIGGIWIRIMIRL